VIVDITTFTEPSDPDFEEVSGLALAGLSLEEMRRYWALRHPSNKPLDSSKESA
jgi:hypothetical protein